MEATLLLLTVKEGQLDAFTDIYKANPFKVITEETNSTSLYVLCHDAENNTQVTFMIWNSKEERETTQAAANVNEAITVVKTSGNYIVK